MALRIARVVGAVLCILLPVLEAAYLRGAVGVGRLPITALLLVAILGLLRWRIALVVILVLVVALVVALVRRLLLILGVGVVVLLGRVLVVLVVVWVRHARWIAVDGKIVDEGFDVLDNVGRRQLREGFYSQRAWLMNDEWQYEDPSAPTPLHGAALATAPLLTPRRGREHHHS